MDVGNIGKALVRLEKDVKALQNTSRLARSSIENTSIAVNDGTGGLRAIIGVQADGTTAVNVVNGAAPPQPSAPIVTSVLGGVTVSWDGTFAGGAVLPLDWSRVEVHAAIVNGFTPVAATLRDTIETAQGATVVVPCDTPVYVRLVARNTSGTASIASVQIGPFGPTPVVADDIVDGIVTTLKLADDAVTQAKLAAAAVGSTELQAGSVLAAKLADAAVEVGKIANNAVTGPAIASDAVTAGKVAADAITAREIAAGAVTAAEIAAGAVTTDKLTVTGGANLLTDPSFEGAYTAAIIAGQTFATQDTSVANGSATSLKFDCTAASATTRQIVITNIPVLPGEQINLAFDYWVSTDWNGSEVDFQIRWETAAGTLLSFGKATTTSPVRNTWTRLSATVTAPATAGNAKVRAESVGATAGIVRFDNASVRPVLAGTQIQDGVITTQKIAALTILAGNIAADAVAAGKIAADAVTAREIAALAVTAAEIAANTITAGKLAVGAVDATALAADAITGKTITGGTVTGALIQTAASGERITLNEASANKVLVYDGIISSAIAELSKRGLLVQGSSGAILWLDPNDTFPNLRLTNAAGTKSAIINVSGSDAILGLNSGLFTGSTFSDMKWRSWFGNDFWVTERVRDSVVGTNIGGRLFLANDHATIAYNDTTGATVNNSFYVYEGFAQVGGGRLEVIPPASSNTALYVNAATGHTGPLMKLRVNSVDKFVVDKDGKVAASNLASGHVTITPSAANTPTSINVTGLNLVGTPRVVATAGTSLPGTQVTGVGVTNVTTTGFTIWVTRTNTTSTGVDWIALCE